MKLIIAIVRPFTVEKIVNAFEDIEGFPGMTVINSEGFGQGMRASTTDAIDPFKPTKRIEISANDEMVPIIIAAILKSAHTGKKGDGLITVVDVDTAFFI